MANKLVQQQLKNIIRSLSDRELEKVLLNFENVSSTKLERSCKMISYKCYEATISSKNRKANGYGRSENEASMNCIKNFLEFVIEEDSGVQLVMRSLKKVSDSNEMTQGNENQKAKVEEKYADRPPQSSFNPHRSMAAKDNDKINNTLALNASYLQAENNLSFDLKGDIEALSKNIGNISMINNSKINDPNANVSQLEMDDLILKMMLEDPGNKKGLPPNPHAHHYTNQNHQNFGNPQAHQPATNENKYQMPPKDPKNLFQKESTTLQRTSSKTNFHEEKEPHVEKTSTKATSSVQEDFRFDSGHEKKYENYSSTNKLKSSASSKFLESTSVQQQHFASVNENLSKHHYSTSSNHCTCNCAEQLQRANLKIENLEKKIKLLLEENKILKYLAADGKEKELKTEPSVIPSKVLSEKPSVHNEIVQDNCEVSEIPEKQPVDRQPVYRFLTKSNNTKDVAEKSRSVSVDTYSKRLNTYHTSHDAYNKENHQSVEKKDIKKMIPRLRLEVLPNYHGKTNPPQNENASLTKTYSSTNTQMGNIVKTQLQKTYSTAVPNMMTENILYSQSSLGSSNYLK